MFRSTSILLCFALVVLVHGGPLQHTDEYIEQIEKGISELKRLSLRHHFTEEEYDKEKYDESHAKEKVEEYDFIIVGSGSSGAVLANRLSEVPEWKILLLEAGAPETVVTEIPAIAYYLQHTPYSWNFHSVPQNNSCYGMKDHRCYIPSGKALGGDTATNNMIFTRGNPRDYDLWADVGNEDWCNTHVLPVFKKLEDAFIKNPDKKMHRYGGPVHLETPHHQDQLVNLFMDAAHEIGLKEVDYNGKHQVGVGLPQTICKEGPRNSVAKAYLEPAHKRENLMIRPFCHVTEVIVTPHTKEAQGVKYIHEGKLRIAKAKKEVILATGSINTPKLLQLSGIGPKHLEKIGIEVIHELPVGDYLRSRPAYVGLNFMLPEETIRQFNEEKHEEEKIHDELLEYFKKGEGKLTSTGVKALGYVRTQRSKVPDYPDVELLLTTKMYNHSWDEAMYNEVWKPMEEHHSFTIQVIVNHPKSKGHVYIHDKDPLHQPKIELNMLSDEDEHDIETILAGIQTVLKMSETEPFKKLGVKLNKKAIPACSDYTHGTDDYWRCSIKYLTVSMGDLTGSARMGPHGDHDSVVDHKLKVHGVQNLRVVDASVIPVPITGHIMGPTIMVGEKAAHIIKEEWH